MNEQSVKKIMKIIFKDPNLSKNQIKDLLNQALKIAEDSEDYSSIATHACHDKSLADKVWGRELFKIAIKKSDITYGTSDLYDIARQIATKEQLNDKIWAKEIYIEAINKTKYIDDLKSIAENVLNQDDIANNKLARKALEKALSLSIDTYEKIEIATIVSHDDFLADKEWAKNIINEIPENTYCRGDYLMTAILFAHSKTLNAKEDARVWFEKAIVNEECYGDYADYYSIAEHIFNIEGLNDKQWAADLCLKGYKNVFDTEEIINMAQLVYQTYPDEAKNMILYVIKLIENNNEDYTSDDLFNVAAKISDEKLSSIPFFNDKIWGKEIFDKAINIAQTDEEKMLITESMNQYL